MTQYVHTQVQNFKKRSCFCILHYLESFPKRMSWRSHGHGIETWLFALMEAFTMMKS